MPASDAEPTSALQRGLLSIALGGGAGAGVGALQLGFIAFGYFSNGVAGAAVGMQVGALMGLLGGLWIGPCALLRHTFHRLGAGALAGALQGAAFSAFLTGFGYSLGHHSRADAAFYGDSLRRSAAEGLVPGVIFGILVVTVARAVLVR